MSRSRSNTVAEPGEPTVRAAIGLGGNVGNVPDSMSQAILQLDAHPQVERLAVSALYRTPPWGKTDQAWFFNACVLIGTRLPPAALLELCLEIERGLKRDRRFGERWGPRPIDLDLLLYGDRQVTTERLTVPHPRMTERAFVLLPLAEIAPDWPVAGRAVSDWASLADPTGIERIDDPAVWPFRKS
jgi:2-amino-4-hydroxy-6-hydroxymethyldihydropteridine diphosphokinase